MATPALSLTNRAVALPAALARTATEAGALSAARTVVVAGWLGFLIISESPNLQLRVFPATVALHAVVGAGVVLYLAYLALSRRLPRRTPLDAAVALLLAAYAVATAASVSWRLSIEPFLLVIGAIGVFYLLADGPFRLDEVRRGLMLAVTTAAVAALYVVAGDYWEWLRFANAVDGSVGWRDLAPPTVPRVHDVGDHPNILAMALTLGVPFLIVSAFTGRAAGRLTAAGGLALVVAALFFTLSRAAWAATGIAGLLTLGGLVLVGRPASGGLERTTSWLRQTWFRFAPAFVALAAIPVAAVIAVLLLRWDSRPEWLFRGSLSPRLDALAAGGDMFRDNPLFGTGPGVYPLLYNEYSGAHPIHSVHSHNGFLQTAVDLGAPGVAFMGVAALGLAALFYFGYRRGDRSRRLLLLAGAAAIVGFLVHSLADTPNLWKTSLVALAATLAIVLRAADPTPERAGGGAAEEPLPRRARPWRIVAPAAVIVSLYALLFFWAGLDLAQARYTGGLDLANEGRWEEASLETRRAVDRDSDFALYQLQLGLEETMAFLETGDRQLLAEAIAHLERGVALDPRSALGHANLARAYALGGLDDDAVRAVAEARRWAGQDLAIALATAEVLEGLGRETEAVDAYAAALSLNASLAGSSFWTTTEFRREAYPEVLARSTLGLNPCLIGNESLFSDDPPLTTGLARAAEDCRGFIVLQPDNVGARLGLAYILMAQGLLEEALPILDEQVSLHPDDGPTRRALGRYYDLAGDREAARHEWLLAGQLDDPLALVLLGDSYPAGEVPEEVIARAKEVLPLSGASVTLGGVQRYLLGIHYYRVKYGRESPFVILIPGDWQQAVGSPFVALSEALNRWRSAAGE